MRDIYIGGQRVKKSGVRWKIYLFFFFFIIVLGMTLKVSAPWIVESWLNKHGMENRGYAYTVREIELALRKGELTLKDVKIFNLESKTSMIESPSLKLKIDLKDIFQSNDRKIKVSGEELTIFLSKDLASEITRMKTSELARIVYLKLIEGDFSKVSIIEKKESESRRQIEFFNVNFKMKEVSLVSVTNKTEFSLTSKVINGGEFILSGKMQEDAGRRFWSVQGALKNFSPDFLNKVAGNELPFLFNEAILNAEIIAESRDGELKGEIVPDVTRLNLVAERVGLPRQVIARTLNEDLTFSLPFRLKDQLTFEYEDIYKKLKEYRKYPLRVSFRAYSQGKN